MTNIDPDVCKKLKEARREAGISQSELAREVGCNQSALSSFERGDGTKLNDEVIAKLSNRFGVEIVERSVEAATDQKVAAFTPEAEFMGLSQKGTGFCPNPSCPSHHVYEVEGKTYLRPDRAMQDPVGAKFCAVCGEVLERKCPHCGAPVHDGAICSWCGSPYLCA